MYSMLGLASATPLRYLVFTVEKLIGKYKLEKILLRMSNSHTVTRCDHIWLEKVFKFWPFTTIKMFPIARNCQMLKKPWKNCQKPLIFLPKWRYFDLSGHVISLNILYVWAGLLYSLLKAHIVIFFGRTFFYFVAARMSQSLISLR